MYMTDLFIYKPVIYIAGYKWYIYIYIYMYIYIYIYMYIKKEQKEYCYIRWQSMCNYYELHKLPHKIIPLTIDDREKYTMR